MADEADDVPTYSANNLPEGGWREYRKKVTTLMLPMPGPFRVETSETDNEPFYCADGFLAVDQRGYPYPVATGEHALIYEEVGGHADE